MFEASTTARGPLTLTLRRVVGFSRRVLADFMANRGILLAGGVGYNVLLSIVPLLAVVASVLALVVDEARLVSTIRAQAQLIAPGHAALLVDAVERFLESREVISIVGFMALLFFSSLAFRMLQDAIAIIFRGRERQPRKAWISFLIPYAYVLALGIGILALTLTVAIVDQVSERTVPLPGMDLALGWAPVLVLYVSSFIGIGLFFTSIYKVLPPAPVALRRALVGGFVAAALWELLLRMLVYYFDNISLVATIYGSFATIVVVLLSLELGAVIVLLGAQVIAELERNAAAGARWFEDRSGASSGPGPHS